MISAGRGSARVGRGPETGRGGRIILSHQVNTHGIDRNLDGGGGRNVFGCI